MADKTRQVRPKPLQNRSFSWEGVTLTPVPGKLKTVSDASCPGILHLHLIGLDMSGIVKVLLFRQIQVTFNSLVFKIKAASSL